MGIFGPRYEVGDDLVCQFEGHNFELVVEGVDIQQRIRGFFIDIRYSGKVFSNTYPGLMMRAVNLPEKCVIGRVEDLLSEAA